VPQAYGSLFSGNAPSIAGFGLFDSFAKTTVFHVPWGAGWGPLFAGRPTALWRPEVRTSASDFGFRTNQFGFTIGWASGGIVVIQACTNLAGSVWFPLQTNTLAADTFYFSDPSSTIRQTRFYRICSPSP